VLDVWVIWVVLAFSLVFALLAVVVYAPARREPFSALCFLGAFIVGELPGGTRR